MKKRAWVLVALLGALGGGLFYWFSRPVRIDPGDRASQARQQHLTFIRRIFREADVAYPPDRIYLRGLKTEQRLELWAAPEPGAPFRHVHDFTITATSGKPGPKRREGDRQVPEGFYTIDRFNPRSAFFLSLGLDYPNASDRQRSDPETPGFDIFIHGGAQTVGCLPLGDDRVGALYTIATDAGNRLAIPVHLFPSARQDGRWHPEIEGLAKRDPALAQFWAELAPAFDIFERTRRPPAVTVSDDGGYRINDP